MTNQELQYRCRRDIQNRPNDFREGDELWYAEACSPDQPDVAVGYAKIKKTSDDRIVWVDWLHVDQQLRRQGIATRLMNMLIERWPNAEYEAWTADGEEFLRSFRRKQLERSE